MVLEQIGSLFAANAASAWRVLTRPAMGTTTFYVWSREVEMGKRFMNVCAMSAFAAAAGGFVCAQDGAAPATNLEVFVGSWKENQPQSRPFISSALTYTFTADPDGFITIGRGGVQLRDRVRMDGREYQTPDVEGRTVSWVRANAALYRSTIKRDGTVVATGRWLLSEGGKHLRQETTPVRANGDADVNVIDYVRASGDGETLIGEWKPVSTRSALPDAFVITRVADELSVFYPKYGATVYTMRPDGKRYALNGPNALPGATTSAQAVATRSLRRTTFREDRPTLETVMTVSPDGRTMTVTTHAPDTPNEASVFVYEKQD